MADIKHLTKEVVTDPGVGFSVRNTLLFAAGTNAFGLAACLAATGVAAATKALGVHKPERLKKYPRIEKILTDNRTPLQAISAALLAVGVISLASGAWLPAIASTMFAIGNFMTAESIRARIRAAQGLGHPSDKKEQSAFRKVLSLTFKRPDIYLNIGFACAGLMAGPSAYWLFPAITGHFGISMYNALKQKPEYNGHPKLFSAAAAAVFAGIGVASGNILPALSHAIGAAVIFNVESRVTPGGAKQIIKDYKKAFMRALKRPAQPTENSPSPSVMPQDPPSKLTTTDDITKKFNNPSAPPVDDNASPQKKNTRDAPKPR